MDKVLQDIKKLNKLEEEKLHKRFPKTYYKKKLNTNDKNIETKISNYQITSYISKKRYKDYKDNLRKGKNKDNDIKLKNFDKYFDKLQ